MPDYRVPPACTGLTMEDGTRYNAGRDGRVIVDNPNHQRAIERNGHIGGGHIHRITMGAPPRTRSRTCTPCRFVGYAWQAQCPKCGGPLESED